MKSKITIRVRGKISEILPLSVYAKPYKRKVSRGQKFSIELSKRKGDYIWLTVGGCSIEKDKFVVGQEIEVDFCIEGAFGTLAGLNSAIALRVQFLNEKYWFMPTLF